jgi:Family of unknown function (DUF5329)
MRLLFKYGKPFMLGLLPFTSMAVPTTESEINHLLKFIQSSECQYERNGDKHSGEEAAEHIKKKYHYFKRKIVTTEDFIRLSATKSAVTGNRYRVHCPGAAVQESNQWLFGELRKYRK